MIDKKYEYYLYTWGGFYNDEHKRKHGEDSGGKWFDTYEERQEYIDKLIKIRDELNARELCVNLASGYNTRTEVILHRVVEYKGNHYYSTYNAGVGYPYSAAEYIMNHKWYVGFNDDVVEEKTGDKIEERDERVVIIQEWITGAFDVNEED